MGRIWAVARQTAIECSRARLTAVFLLAMTAGLLLLPMVAAGGALRDQIQSFLEYSLTLVALLMGMMTILLACGMLCGEIEKQQVFGPIIKPVARWQYVLGRWLGIVVVQAVLVAIVGTAIFAMAHYLHLQSDDEQARADVTREVFIARSQYGPSTTWQKRREDQRIAQHVADLKKEGRYDEMVDREGEESVTESITKDIVQKLKVVTPGKANTWQFTGLRQLAERESTIQFRFRIDAARPPEDKILQGYWELVNPTSGYLYTYPVHSYRSAAIPVASWVTLTVPADVISEKGEMAAGYRNLSPMPVTVAADELAVLYPVGGFTMNFVRGLILVLALQVSLAALAVLAASWLSFPVACLGCFVLYMVGLMSSFITQSIKLDAKSDVWDYISYFASRGALFVLPDFNAASPAGDLVDGLLIPWQKVLVTVGVFIGVQSAAALLLACLLFRRRELARVIA